MENNKYISVAIDGPAGAGKSSISKAVASELGFVYIDTGAMYRSVALYAIENGIDTKNETDKLISKLDEINIEIKYTADGQCVILNGKDVSKTIRREDVSVGASNVAVIPKVREKLVHMQQEMAKNDNVIMDGRDICSHVLPNAQVKIFLTASTEARAMRRYKELVEKGVECDFDTIKKDMEYRDENDSNRAVSPLHKADDAVLVDTTELNFNQTVERIKELIKNGI
jgi:cytidylate kinase